MQHTANSTSTTPKPGEERAPHLGEVALHHLVDELPVGLVVLGPGLQVTEANRQARQWLDGVGHAPIMDALARMREAGRGRDAPIELVVPAGLLGQFKIVLEPSGSSHAIAMIHRLVDQQHRAEQAALRELLSLSAERLTPDEASSRALHTLASVLPSAAVVLYTKQPQRHVLHPLAHVNVPDVHHCLLDPQPMRSGFESAPSHAALEGMAVPLSRLSRSPFPGERSLARAGELSGFAVPVRARGELVGVLWLMGKAGFLGESGLRLVQGLSDALGTVLDRAAQDERQTNEHEALLSLMANLPDALIELDGDASIARAAGRVAPVLGRAPEACEGLAIEDLIDAEDRPGFKRALLGVSTSDTVLHEARVIRADGRRTSCEISMAVGVATQGQRVVRLVFRDVSRRKALEDDLKRANVLSAQREKLISLGQLAAGVAHEVNNPLAFVLANLEFLAQELPVLTSAVHEGRAVPEALDDALGALGEMTEVIAEARQGAERMRAIVRDLKAFSYEDNQLLAPVDVRDALQAAMNIATSEFRHKAQLHTDFGDVAPVMANEGRLGQVFLNLLINAAQALPDENSDENAIWLTTRTRKSGAVEVRVRDNGIGIAPAHIRRIFDPFFTTKPVGLGTGLGLSICHGIVTSLGGHIDVESTASEGTEFTVVLPACAPSTAPSTPRLIHGPAEAEPAPARVLVVDDETSLLHAMKRFLSREHDVEIASSGPTALDVLNRDPGFDVVLCDLMMPGMSGMDIHKHLMQNQPDMAERMVFMTGGTFSADAKRFLDSVQNPTLEKPFELSELTRLIHATAGKLD